MSGIDDGSTRRGGPAWSGAPAPPGYPSSAHGGGAPNLAVAGQPGGAVLAPRPIDPEVVAPALRRFCRRRYLWLVPAVLALVGLAVSLALVSSNKVPVAPAGGHTAEGTILATVDFGGAPVYRVKIGNVLKDVPAGDTGFGYLTDVWVVYDANDLPASVSRVDHRWEALPWFALMFAIPFVPAAAIAVPRALRVGRQMRGPLVLTYGRVIASRAETGLRGALVLLTRMYTGVFGRLALRGHSGSSDGSTARIEVTRPERLSLAVTDHRGMRAVGIGPIVLADLPPGRRRIAAYSVATDTVVRVSRR